MLSNFAFSLYEIFGYLIPGSLTLAGFGLSYWALFEPRLAFRPAAFQPGVGTWVIVVVACYVLGHAVQAAGNVLLRPIENAVSEMTSMPLLRESAMRNAAALFGVVSKEVEPGWRYRVLDEYSLQTGIPGDRDMFIYREGFYRAGSVALFFLAASVGLRAVIPGAALRLTHWTRPVHWWESAVTAAIVGSIGFLFLQRYRRFAEYRVTRAVLASLVLLQKRNGPAR
jgi:hypothetical protein